MRTLGRESAGYWIQRDEAASSASTNSSPFDDSADQKRKQWTIVRNHYRSSSRPNSLRGLRFAALYEALHTLGTLPEDHQFHLDPVVAKRASNYLGMISTNLDIEPPRLFPQDGEAAVFTWDIGPIKRLFTVDVDDVDLTDVNRNTMMRCDHELPEDWREQFPALLQELGGKILAFSSSATDGDA